jgi:hypothetical protein
MCEKLSDFTLARPNSSIKFYEAFQFPQSIVASSTWKRKIRLERELFAQNAIIFVDALAKSSKYINGSLLHSSSLIENRKHMKRHERPYGCAISGCDKAFGSKHDWNRHEMSQHWSTLTTRVYRCNAYTHLDHGDVACTNTCMSLKAAVEHQQRFHSIHDPEEASSKVYSGVYVMRNWESTF